MLIPHSGIPLALSGSSASDGLAFFHDEAEMLWDDEAGYSFMLYGVRDVAAPPLAPTEMSLWGPGHQSRYYCIYDDIWPIRVDLYEIYCPRLPKDVAHVLGAMMCGLLAQGALLSFFMFDGTFMDITELLESEWYFHGTYGIALPAGRAGGRAVRWRAPRSDLERSDVWPRPAICTRPIPGCARCTTNERRPISRCGG